LPVSPVSGELGGFKWKVPVEGIAYEEPETEAEEHDDTVPGDDAIAITTPETQDTPVAPEPEEEVIVQKTDDAVEDIPAEADDVVEVPEEKPVKDAEEKPAAEAAEKTVEDAEVQPLSPDGETPDKTEPPASPAEPDKIDAKAGKGSEDVKAKEEASVFARQPDDPGPVDEAGKKPEKTWL
jgi:uncharacterized membrane-anchored protein